MGLGISGSVAAFALWLQASRACVAPVMRHGGMSSGIAEESYVWTI